MGLFTKKQDDFVDLTQHYKMKQRMAIDKKKAEEKRIEEGGSKLNFYPDLDKSSESSSMSEELIGNNRPEVSAPSTGGFMSGMFGGNTVSEEPVSNVETQSSYVGTSQTDNTEKRKRLAKRLMDMTDKIEELGNQIYHLQQRIEVLERKNSI